MKKKILLAVVLFIGMGLWLSQNAKSLSPVSKKVSKYEAIQNDSKIESGDIIFQSSQSSLSLAIQQATHSTYCHVGIIFKDDNKFYVYEAVQPVCITPLQDWIDRGEGKHFVIKRLKNAEKLMTQSAVEKMKNEASKHLGKNYDGYFEWSDERIYCSELVWKTYKQVLDIEIGELQSLSDFDLTSDLVKRQLKQRYGNNIPMNEQVISPAAMFDSNLLFTVKEG